MNESKKTLTELLDVLRHLDPNDLRVLQNAINYRLHAASLDEDDLGDLQITVMAEQDKTQRRITYWKDKSRNYRSQVDELKVENAKLREHLEPLLEPFTEPNRHDSTSAAILVGVRTDFNTVHYKTIPFTYPAPVQGTFEELYFQAVTIAARIPFEFEIPSKLTDGMTPYERLGLTIEETRLVYQQYFHGQGTSAEANRIRKRDIVDRFWKRANSQEPKLKSAENPTQYKKDFRGLMTDISKKVEERTGNSTIPLSEVTLELPEKSDSAMRSHSTLPIE